MPTDIDRLPPGKRVRVAPGVRRDRYGFEGYFKLHGKYVHKRFPPTTTVPAVLRWVRIERQNRILDEEMKPQEKATITGGMAPCPRGWCYIYFVRIGECVKIGRAKDVWKRLGHLQPAHHEPMKLLAAVPGHPSLEQALHAFFEKYKAGGEWFDLGPDLVAFIAAMRNGVNPVAILFDATLLDGWRGKPPVEPVTQTQ